MASQKVFMSSKKKFKKKTRIRTHYILRNTCGLKRGHLIRKTGSWRFRSSVAKMSIIVNLITNAKFAMNLFALEAEFRS